jgi:hypothetical protein
VITIIFVVELLKIIASVSHTNNNSLRYYVVNFSNNSFIWFFIFYKCRNRREGTTNQRAYVTLKEALKYQNNNNSSLQFFCDVFLHSLPMIVLAIQSLNFRFVIHQPISAWVAWP